MARRVEEEDENDNLGSQPVDEDQGLLDLYSDGGQDLLQRRRVLSRASQWKANPVAIGCSTWMYSWIIWVMAVSHVTPIACFGRKKTLEGMSRNVAITRWSNPELLHPDAVCVFFLVSRDVFKKERFNKEVTD